ncbi:hypothetical protein C8K30_1039 [Promicromonospora sp. AC04]|uniref:hypothetical protein n=1 Tax=Promicromonospora sp. AC04 TaxID=2135723 RepID=UPI000D339B1B|nr:hypothetical protein [Promicromonospora sp. AC04]PUB28593.1 hypothetical protein C8K30_1039 [Promicromonospora sp. AC04]
MSRAEWLDSARRYLFEAKNGLEGASRALDRVEFTDAAETARDLHKGAEALHFEIRLAAVIAHRAQYPEFYDETGKWVGRQDDGEQG